MLLTVLGARLRTEEAFLGAARLRAGEAFLTDARRADATFLGGDFLLVVFRDATFRVAVLRAGAFLAGARRAEVTLDVLVFFRGEAERVEDEREDR